MPLILHGEKINKPADRVGAASLSRFAVPDPF
jgi:hypothetical protein